MWLLLVAAGSGYLARCWRNALQQRPPPPPPPSAETDCNQDDPSKEQHHPFDPLSSFQAEALGRSLLCDIALIASSAGDNSAIEPAAKMTNQEENAVGQKKTGLKVEFDRDERIMDLSFPRRTTKRLFDSSASDRASGEVFAPRGSALESSLDTTHQDVILNERGTDTVPMVAAGKRTIDFSNRAVHDGEHAVGFEVKRMRDSHEFKVCHGQEQGVLSAFTFLDNPGFNALWFAPQDGEARNGLKSKTPSRSSRVRGVIRRPRYLRASPKPVSSLESCLRAQLRFQGEREENRVSRSLFFQPYGEAGLGKVETLHTHMGPDLQLGGEFSLQRKHAGLPLLEKPSTRRTDLSSKKHTENSDKSSHDALLFSFGVGVGVLHMLTSNKSEIERLKKCLKEAQSTVQDLQLQLASRGNAEEPPLKIRCDSKHVETASNDALTEDLDSAPSGVTAEEQDNIAELEAQLEAELELMQLQSAPHERIYSGITELDADDLAEVVHDELTTWGVPGVFDLEDDKNKSGHAEGNVSNWAVSPRELDKRLRMLLESRQEERILQLEEELQDAEGKLHCKEKELQLWKDRVRHLTEISISSSGESFSLKDEEVNSLKEVTLDELHLEDKFERPVDAEASHADVSQQGPKLEKAMDQGLSDDICDEFLKCVDTGSSEGLDNVRLETNGRELRSDTCPSTVSDYAHFIESWQDIIGLDEHESCSKGHYKVNAGDDKAANVMQLDTKVESSTFQPDGTSGLKDRDKHSIVSTSNEFELDLGDSQERRAISAWNRDFISHAGANTPIVDCQLNKLFNTPRALRARGQEAAKDNATVLEKIKYWESLAKGSEVPSSPEGGEYSQTDQISPVRFSCSECNSSWEDSSVSDSEEHLGDVLIKRIVEKSRKGSTLLRDVQTMLAALDGNSR